MKQVILALALLLVPSAAGCSPKDNPDDGVRHNYVSVAGTYTVHLRLTNLADDQIIFDDTYFIGATQQGRSVDWFGAQGLARDDRVSIDACREVPFDESWAYWARTCFDGEVIPGEDAFVIVETTVFQRDEAISQEAIRYDFTNIEKMKNPHR